MEQQGYLQTLCNGASPEFPATWGRLFFNPVAIRELADFVAAEDDPLRFHNQLLLAGANWDGSGWTTSRAAKTIHKVTGVALVEESLEEYKNAFLFALSVVLNVDIPRLQLGSAAGAAALEFAAVVAGKPNSGSERLRKPPQEEQAAEEAEDVQYLDWEVVPEPLPPVLAQIWQRVAAGDRRLPRKGIL